MDEMESSMIHSFPAIDSLIFVLIEGVC